MDEAGNKTLSLGDVIKANLISSAIISGVKELANGIKELAKGAISVGMDFESGMSQVAATMGMTTQEIAGEAKLIQNWKMQQKKPEIQHSLARHRQQKPLTIWHLPDTMQTKR